MFRKSPAPRILSGIQTATTFINMFPKEWPLGARVAVALTSIVAVVAVVGLLVKEAYVPVATAMVAAGSVIAGAWLAGQYQSRQLRSEIALRNKTTAYLRLSELFLVMLRHMAAVSQIRNQTPGRVYYDKKRAGRRENQERSPPGVETAGL